MKKLLIGLILLLGVSSSYTAEAFTFNLSKEDRLTVERLGEIVNEGLKIFDDALKTIPKTLTQGGIVFISTSTAVLSVYSVFLVLRYEFSRQPDPTEPTKNISWKSVLGGTVGASAFAASILALAKSSALADYAMAS